ncbi:hypothetical protein VN97_g12301, partial [Penicillium thymicola]
KEKIER